MDGSTTGWQSKNYGWEKYSYFCRKSRLYGFLISFNFIVFVYFFFFIYIYIYIWTNESVVLWEPLWFLWADGKTNGTGIDSFRSISLSPPPNSLKACLKNTKRDDQNRAKYIYIYIYIDIYIKGEKSRENVIHHDAQSDRFSWTGQLLLPGTSVGPLKSNECQNHRSTNDI